MSAALTVRNLEVRYDGGLPVVVNYDIDVLAGTVTVILGRNGAGKTSTLRGIVGFLPHEHGTSRAEVTVNEVVVKSRDPLAMSKAGLTLVLERDKVFSNMRVMEQLKVFTSDRSRLAEVLRYFPRLEERGDVRAGMLSGGERQMLAIGLALLGRPKVLLVDELSLGLAPGMIRELMSYLRRLAEEEGLAILAADQAVGPSLEVADNVQVMDGGKVIVAGSPSDLGVDSILNTYLGVDV
jgi:branched-chain amino acid transport system ATP-binding protein